MRYIFIAGAVMSCAVLPLESQEPEPLQDNSFLIEEAYNQEPGVVQEINSFLHASGAGDWLYVLTQEWPVGGIRNQLSYSLSFEHESDFNSTGLGDALVNYRFQAIGAGGGQVYFAPRLSVVLPTGRPESGRGNGAFGLQTNLPVTLMLTPEDAERITLAQHAGSITLTLRNPLDVDPTKTNGVKLVNLMRGGLTPEPEVNPVTRKVKPRPAPAPVVAPAPPPPVIYRIEKFSGGKSTSEIVN